MKLFALRRWKSICSGRFLYASPFPGWRILREQPEIEREKAERERRCESEERGEREREMCERKTAACESFLREELFFSCDKRRERRGLFFTNKRGKRPPRHNKATFLSLSFFPPSLLLLRLSSSTRRLCFACCVFVIGVCVLSDMACLRFENSRKFKKPSPSCSSKRKNEQPSAPASSCTFDGC